MPDAPRPNLAGQGSSEFSVTATEAGDYPVRTTLPDQLVRHDISDQELGMFRHWRTDETTNYMLAAIGAAAGSFIGATRNVYVSYWKEGGPPLDAVGLLEILVFVASITIVIFCYRISEKRGDKFNEKITEIRARTRARSDRLQVAASLTTRPTASPTGTQSPPSTEEKTRP